ADTYTEGYRIGFAVSNKDIKKKKTVKVEFPIGMERMIRLAVKNFEKIGLESIIIRGKTRNCYGTSVNRQFEYDHKDDSGYYFNKGYVERALEVLKKAFDEHAVAAKVHGGPAVVDAFGEEDFHPKNKAENYSFDEKQNELQVYYRSKSGELTNTYIPGDERSFTIIAYPLPSIGKDFEEIFRETVKLNTLDYVLYRDMQQKLIDTLDQGYAVRVKGSNGNKTDIVVKLHPLKDPKKETIFENCVADVNIPVGEVFTSPVLEGTNGILNVSKVYLGEYSYDNMTLKFEDGVVREYSCDNFENPEEGKKLIYDNVMFRHEFLPLGEFAIGTNTTAFVMARKYKIEDKMPILIAEKTGPHFAVGDTCYSHAEDVAMFNPDGKEVVARSNTYADLRDTDPQKAYFNCHTDITIPYDELGEITVLCEDGREIPIILDGRFVVPGTEELNRPLDEQ
ncbi:MAG: aminopeptidase, partial [Lachnospiraceae bacterium]|nr:aminopeptidase [Lachnospiraceae bacterium]